MATTTVWAALTGPRCPNRTYPRRGLACVVALVILASVWLVTLHLLGLFNILFAHPRITASIVIVATFASAVASCLLLSHIDLPEGTDAAEETASGVPLAIKAIVALAAVPYAVLLVNSFLAYPNGTDAIAYHINVALAWLQTGSIRLDTAMGWQYCLPGNGEMPALFALSLGLERAVFIGNLLSSILLAASVYSIAWKLTKQTASSLLSALLVTTIPIVIYQTFELYVELFGTAFMVAAVALMLWRDKSPLLFVFLSACATGVSFGVKPIFWVYGVVYGIGSLILVWRQNSKRLQCIALIAAGLALTSGFWFFRAAMSTGNPLYPMSLSLPSHGKAEGYSAAHLTHTATNYDARLSSLLWELEFPWSEPFPADGRLPVESDRGTGPLFAALAVPGVLFMIVQAVRRRTTPLQTALLVGTVAALALWAVHLRIIRFSLPAMALSCAVAAPLLGELLANCRRSLYTLCFAGLIMNAAYCLPGPTQRLVRQVERRDWSRATYYGYPPILDRITPGGRVYDHFNRVWGSMLAGSGLTNSVRYWGSLKAGDYIVRAGPKMPEDDSLISGGKAELIYDGIPASLYPKVAMRWRVYRVR
jgi:hypothetical protein